MQYQVVVNSLSYLVMLVEPVAVQQQCSDSILPTHLTAQVFSMACECGQMNVSIHLAPVVGHCHQYL